MREKVYWFFHERKDFYRVIADSKEEALEKLEEAEDQDSERYYDRSEIAVDWEPYGVQQENEWGEREWIKDDQ